MKIILTITLMIIFNINSYAQKAYAMKLKINDDLIGNALIIKYEDDTGVMRINFKNEYEEEEIIEYEFELSENNYTFNTNNHTMVGRKLIIDKSTIVHKKDIIKVNIYKIDFFPNKDSYLKKIDNIFERDIAESMLNNFNSIRSTTGKEIGKVLYIKGLNYNNLNNTYLAKFLWEKNGQNLNNKN